MGYYTPKKPLNIRSIQEAEQRRLQSLSAPTPAGPTPAPAQPQPPAAAPSVQPDVSSLRKQFFQSKRDEIDRNFRGAQQEQEDQIARRMAAIGQSGSGAAMGLSLKGREMIENQEQAAKGALAGQEAGEEMNYLTANEMADKDRSFKQKLFDLENANKLKELDLAERQFLLDKDTTEFNKEMALLEFNRPGPGGVLGTGIPSLGQELVRGVSGSDSAGKKTGYSSPTGGGK